MTLTDKLAKTFPTPAHDAKITYDSEIRGFGVRVTSKDARAWILRYRFNGIERRLTIGDVSSWPVRNAKERAKELRRQIDSGVDPLAERQQKLNEPTVKEVIEQFRKLHLAKRRDETQRGYNSVIDHYILPEFGRKKITEIRHLDIEKLHHKIAAKAPTQANRVVVVIGVIFDRAIKWEMVKENPARGIELTTEHKRERYLSPAELSRLSAALDDSAFANAIRLILLTGARKGETLTAKWSDFDLAEGIWSKPASTTKGNKLHRVPLSNAALLLLGSWKADAEAKNKIRLAVGLPEVPWVFPGRDGHIVVLSHFWKEVCGKAKLENARIHDLRHTYASILVSSGQSLPIIAALLGHRRLSSTERYAHLMDDPLRVATERVGAVVSGGESAEVIELNKRRG